MTDYTQRRYGSQGDGWRADERAARPAYEDDPLAELARLVADDRAAPAQQRRQPEFAPAAAPAHRDEPQFADERAYHEEPAMYAAAAPAVEPARQEAYAEEYQDPSYADPHYTDDGHMPAAEDYADEDMEPRPRRRGLTLVMAVLGIAAVGTGGVFAYKFLGGRGLTGGPPPVIKAQSEPTKVVPEKAQTAEAPSSNKLIYDRVGSDTKANPKVVGGAEEPLERPPSTQRDVSRVILPGGPAPAGAPAAGAPAGTASADQGGAANAAPLDARKVKTFVIRPDGTVAEASTGQPVATVANTGTALPPNQPIAGQGVAEGMSMVSGRTFGIMSSDGGAAPAAAADSGSVPMPVARPSSVAAAPAAPAAEPVRTASAAGPMPVPTAPAGQPTRIAPAASTPQPAAATPTPPRTAAVNPAAATAATGGFQVQLTSQKSEADARAAFTNLQRKFPQILGSYQPRITSADLGDRGTYYRVKVGPFTSRDEASSFCSSLKSAGGDCVVN